MKTLSISVFLSAAAIPASSAQWVYEALHQYQRPGAVSSAPLVVHSDGKTYGTASGGGTLGGGTVFRVDPGGVTTIASLGGSLGSTPLAGLVSGADGNLYGTCSAGGTGNFGTIFKLTPDGVVTVVKTFTGKVGSTLGSVPGELVLHSDGNFYGTTRAGGNTAPVESGGFGVVFRVSPAGDYTVMAHLPGNGDPIKGPSPVGRLAISGTNLYGVTRSGGTGDFGTVFRISTTAGFAFTTLFEFTGNGGSQPGSQAAGGLVLHSDGNFYGTAERGGANGFGTAFRMTPAGDYTLLHTFADATASQPVGQLVEGSGGWLHGAAKAGGSAGFGGLFRLSTAGVHEVQATFTGANGASPQAGPLRRAEGTFTGVTSAGGPGQLGLVYQLDVAGALPALVTVAPLSPAQGWHPSGAPAALPDGEWVFPVAFGGSLGGGVLARWRESSNIPVPLAIPAAVGQQADGGLVAYAGGWWGLASSGSSFNRGATYSFTPAGGVTLQNAHTTAAGSRAEGPLAAGTDGLLYGVSREGGAEDRGTLFSLNATGARTALFSFTGVSNSYPGRAPRGPLARAANGSFFGLTELGGSPNKGVLFKFTPPSTYQVLAEFDSSGPNTPRGGLITGSDGFLYGTTSLGGANNTGAVLRVDPDAPSPQDSWSIAASFPANKGGPEGELVRATDGAILGFTTTGDLNGAVFRFFPNTNSLTYPVTFTGTGGSAPGAALSANTSGTKFTGGLRELSPGRWLGVASGGGSGAGGVIFRLTHTTGSPRNAWTTTELPGMDGSGDGDPDGDRIPNSVEYALGSDPGEANPSALPQPFMSGGQLQIVVPRIPARNDVTYVVESSTTLTGAWTAIATSTAGGAFSGPGYLSGETADTSNKNVIIRLPTPVASSPRGFLRLRVEP